MAGQADAHATRKSSKAYEKWKDSIFSAITHIEQYLDDVQDESPTLTEIRIRCDPTDEEGVLIILKGYHINQLYVAFHREATFSMALTGAGNRLRNGSLKWREDHGYPGK